MSDTIEIPNNIPVSWLDSITRFYADTLMLASEPNEHTETQYMSKYFTYGQLYNDLCSVFDLGAIWNMICTMWDEKCWISDLYTNALCCEGLNSNNSPYVISAIYQDRGNITKLEGYRLSAGVRRVFEQLGTNPSSTVLSTLIPSLNAKTTVISDPTTQYISSITDYHGHVQSYGYAKLTDALASTLPSNTVGVDSGKYVTSVTTSGGKVTEVGSRTLTADIGSVQYADFSRSSGNADNSHFVSHNLKIMKLKQSQFDTLSSSGQLQKDCIYLTTEG